MAAIQSDVDVYASGTTNDDGEEICYVEATLWGDVTPEMVRDHEVRVQFTNGFGSTVTVYAEGVLHSPATRTYDARSETLERVIAATEASLPAVEQSTHYQLVDEGTPIGAAPRVPYARIEPYDDKGDGWPYWESSMDTATVPLDQMETFARYLARQVDGGGKYGSDAAVEHYDVCHEQLLEVIANNVAGRDGVPVDRLDVLSKTWEARKNEIADNTDLGLAERVYGATAYWRARKRLEQRIVDNTF